MKVIDFCGGPLFFTKLEQLRLEHDICYMWFSEDTFNTLLNKCALSKESLEIRAKQKDWFYFGSATAYLNKDFPPGIIWLCAKPPIDNEDDGLFDVVLINING